jgi:hypothetical protein
MSGKSRVHKRLSASDIAERVVLIDGDKAIRDTDLAALFGISRSRLYAKISRKLWLFQSREYHKLSKAHDRGRTDGRPALAFTQAGVLLVAGILADDESLEIGLDIANAMKTRRRVSASKKRPVRRADDPEKTAKYDAAKRRLIQARLRAVAGKILH